MLDARIRGFARRTVGSLGRRLAPSAEADVRSALSLIRPWDVGIPLIRVGGEGDGGYLVPDDLSGVIALLSPGVSHAWDFERDLGDRFSIPSYMIDGSVDAPPDLSELQQFSREWLSTSTGEGRVSLTDWITRVDPIGESDLILQMDIEGAEWKILAATAPELLARFRIVVVEYHGLPWMSLKPALHRRFMPALNAMSRDFVVVHVHANNCCGTEDLNGIAVPRALEVTYLRRDRIRQRAVRARLPHPLDRDCVNYLPPLRLSADWPDTRHETDERDLDS